MSRKSQKLNSINFDLDNEKKKFFFEKTKNAEIFQNGNSLFLHHIFSIKNKSLLNDYMKRNKSQISSNSELSLSFKNQNKSMMNQIYSKPKPDFNIKNKIIKKDSFQKLKSNEEIKIEIDKDTKNSFFTHKSEDNNNYTNSFGILNTCNYQRKPVMIRYNINKKNKLFFSNFTTHKYFNTNQNISEINKDIDDNSQSLRKKIYSFDKGNEGSSELYRNYQSLEKKSIEIAKRKSRKKSYNHMMYFKKSENLHNIKKNLEKIAKSKNKYEKNRNDKKIINKNKNINIQNTEDKFQNTSKVDKEKKITKKNLQEKNLFRNNKCNIYTKKYDITNQTSNTSLKKYNSTINTSDKIKSSNQNSSKVDKNINEDNIYINNIPNNLNQINDIIPNDTNYFNFNNDKKDMIRFRYSKKYNINQKNIEKKIRANKTFNLNNHIEEIKVSSFELKEGDNFVSRKKSNCSIGKSPKINLPEIKEEEEKVKIEIKIDNRINEFVEKINKIVIPELKGYFASIKNADKKMIRKKFFVNNIVKKNRINNEKQRIILRKKKKFGFFEKYEKCKDFIDNLRIELIKFSLK